MSYKRVAGVYEIRNTLNDKVYVGSSINTSRRLKDHARKLAKGEHESQHLQASWDKYGDDAFKLKLLLICAPKDVLFYEQLIADGFRANEKEFGYNKRLVVATCAGIKKTEEQKVRLRESARRGPDHHYYGRRLSDAAHEAAAEFKKTYKVSDETKAKMRQSSRRGESHHFYGKSTSEAARKASAVKRKLFGISAEGRANMSKALKGLKKPEGFAEKISKARTGAKHSDATKEKMRLAKLANPQSMAGVDNSKKLDKERADKMRELHATGISRAELRAMFGVSTTAVASVINNLSWT